MMKRCVSFLKNLKLSFLRLTLISLGIQTCLFAHTIEVRSLSSSLQEEDSISSRPLHEVATLGAPITGALIEGTVGSIHKGCRHRFYCHSDGPKLGFLGSQVTTKPLSIKDQPGIFPAPLVGPASLTFSFNCQNSAMTLTPTVVRPDGTVFQGLPMTELNSPQTLVISSPAQTGIYTLFVLAHEKDAQGAQVTVEASISTQPRKNKTFHLKSFETKEEDSSLISAEFTYIPTH